MLFLAVDRIAAGTTLEEKISLLAVGVVIWCCNDFSMALQCYDV